MSMTDKTVLITGATNGIGLETAKALAGQGARVVMVGRNPEKTAEAAASVRQVSGNPRVDYLLADLALLAEVRRLADTFCASYDRLDVLVNNAGGVFSEKQMTAEGYEMTFALNHLSYFVLTVKLIDLLKAGAPARIINVASDAHRGQTRINFDNLQSEISYGPLGFGAYSASKLANVLFTYELARRLEGTRVTVNAVHPGMVNTGFGRNNSGLAMRLMSVMFRFGKTPQQGAQTSVYLASSPDVEGVSGKYFADSREVASSAGSYNRDDQQRLWRISEQLTGITW